MIIILIIIDIFIIYICVISPPIRPMTPNLSPQLSLPPSIILSPQERRVNRLAFFGLLPLTR